MERWIEQSGIWTWVRPVRSRHACAVWCGLLSLRAGNTVRTDKSSPKYGFTFSPHNASIQDVTALHISPV